ncbi:MAG: RnfH family protein [Proteobacteria bacterium]|nr:RnfH family protein [Pseudomonadota bacterium]
MTLAWAAPDREWHAAVELPAGATLADALAASGALEVLPEATALRYAIFGENAAADTPLRDGDRIELTRPLIADPKTVRRRRAAERPVKVKAKPPRSAR